MTNFLMRLLVILAAVELAADVVGLIVTPAPVDVSSKQLILTVVLGLTLAWDLVAVAMMTVLPLPPMVTELRRRTILYGSSLAACVTGAALVLLWLPVGLDPNWILGMIFALLVLVLVADMISGYQVVVRGQQPEEQIAPV